MKTLFYSENAERFLVGLLAVFVAMTLGACSKPAQQAAQSQTQQASRQASAPANAKVYHLHGKLLSVDAANNALIIDGDDVPGFMSAMTMPYPVRDKADLTKANPGDEITADIVVPADSSAYLQNIVVVKKGDGKAPASPSSEREPQPGDAVPDFALLDQNGKRIHLSSYRGSALLVTFIYTRCPFPDFCPLVSKNFAQIYLQTKSNPEMSEHMRLLSVSFDPDHDTPAALRAYAKKFDATTGGNPFGRWEFAVVPKDELTKVTGFFGITLAENKDQITHSMSTSVITPDGKIYSWHDDTDWKPSDLIADATATLSPVSAQSTPELRNAGHAIAQPSGGSVQN